jgi:Disulphide bond corrector protein DsbC
MMKKIVLAIAVLAAGFAATAQIKKPVSWTFSSKKIADKTYEVHMTAVISGNYHMYAQKNSGDVVPVSFSFSKNPLLSLQGGVKEVGRLISKYEEVWKMKVNYYEGTVDFVQVVKTKVKAPVSVKGVLNFMVCNDNQCLPPTDVNFDVKIGGN